MIKVNVRRKRNPTNKKLLAEVQIEKLLITRNEYWTWGNPGQLLYRIKIKSVRNIGQDRTIGQARYDPKLKVIDDISIDEKYRRQGLATYLYNYIEEDQKVKLKPSDYIEEDLGRKLKPSEALIEDGEAFWKARLKRSNPKNKKLLNELKIERKLKHRQPPVFNEVYAYNIYHNNKQIGYVWVNKTNSLINKVEILDSDYMRQGIATYLYDYIEKDLDIKLRPSNNLSSDGAEFWKNRLIKNPSSKSKPKNARTLKTSKTKTPR